MRLPPLRALLGGLLGAPFLVLASACGTILPGDAAWNDLHANAYAAVYRPSLSADVNDIVVNDTSAADLDFQGDLDVASGSRSVALFGARVGFAPLELSVAHFGFSGENDAVADGLVTFRGIPVSGSIASTLATDLSVDKLMLGWDALNNPVFRLGLLLGVDLVQIDRLDVIARESAAGGAIQPGDVQTILSDETAPAPIFGFRADVRLPHDFRLGGELTGVSANVDEADFSYTDLDVALHWMAWDPIEIVIGWRALSLDLDGTVSDTVIDISMDLSGPYAGLSFYW